MQKKRSIKIISVVLILVLLCVSITYVKSGNKEVLATTKEFNSENLQDNEHMHVEIDSSGDKVPVPNGYVGSKVTGENEIDTGYVIYEGEEEVNESNIEEAQKTRNQYVWIPVPDATTMYGTDENGKKWGKLYTFTTETGDNIDPVTGAKPLNWSESDGVMKILSTNQKTSYREPDIVSVDTDSTIKLKIGVWSTHEFLIQLETEFNNMIESVQKYKGFYIGRYETGNLNKDIVVVTKGNTDLGSISWYNLYKKSKKLKNNNLNVETGLIWGNQYDRMLIWLIESKNKTIEELCNSTSWGNYKNSIFEYVNGKGELITKNNGKSERIPAGSTEYTKANNIYDLAGNVWEWTMESRYIGTRAYNGGYCFDSEGNNVFNLYNCASPNYVHGIGRWESYAIYKINKRIANNLKNGIISYLLFLFVTI